MKKSNINRLWKLPYLHKKLDLYEVRDNFNQNLPKHY